MRFTSEFGMGSGGSTLLLPPGKLVDVRETVSTIEFGKADNKGFGYIAFAQPNEHLIQTTWVLYGQASRAISTS